ncbi:MAG: adenine nucleotide alpha hydrolase [Acidobacteriales bacterium]|nr:adenine nucleotide alpha hydrolase [Terriglobales bacterium]
MKRALLSWSSGKDSAWSLHVLRQQGEYEVAGLLTTFNAQANRVAMHGVRQELVELQAQAAGVPLWSVPLPAPCSNQEYERIMRHVCAHAVARGIEAVAFGDLFLRDIREYREKQLQGTGLKPLFPLWGTPTNDLASRMIAEGVRARLTCINPAILPTDFAGREFSSELLDELPAGVDPCGENGEFHSCVYAGPMFSTSIAVRVGEVVTRDGFVFADLLPAG